MTEAKSQLQNLGTAEPAFNERRLNLLLRVMETLASGKASTEAKSDSTPEGGVKYPPAEPGALRFEPLEAAVAATHVTL